MTKLPAKLAWGVGDPPQDITAFKEYALAHGADATYEYTWEWTDEHGTEWPGFWQALVAKEELVNGKLIAQFMTISDEMIARACEPEWDVALQLLQMGFERTVEKEMRQR